MFHPDVESVPDPVSEKVEAENEKDDDKDGVQILVPCRAVAN